MKTLIACLLLASVVSAQSTEERILRMENAYLRAQLSVLQSDDPSTPAPDPAVELWYYHSRDCVHCPRMTEIVDRLEMRGVTVHRVDCTGQNYRNVPAVPLFAFSRDGGKTSAAPEIVGATTEEKLCEALGIPAEPTGQNVVTGPVAPPGVDVTICCCSKDPPNATPNPAQCHCLVERRLGRRTTGCGCTKELGSRHVIREDGPWPLGNYRRYAE